MAHSSSSLVLLCIFSLVHSSDFNCPAHAANDGVSLQLTAGKFHRWSPLSFTIQIDPNIQENRPDIVGAANVDIVATSPTGEKLVLPAFASHADSRGGLMHCRFTPREVGTYTAYARLEEENSSNSVTFDVDEASGEKGFLQLDQSKPFFMRFDNQELFRGIGINIGWEPRRRRHAEHTYDALMPKLADRGVNTVRTWMCPWNMPMEWDRELGDYNQDSLRRLDELLELAKQHGIYIILVLGYHGELQTTSGSFPGNDRWKENPYNFKNGGPCKSPEDFFTNKEAIALYKQRLRHLVARIASHPHLLVWEFWNEVDHIQNRGPVSDAAMVSWHKEMAEFLRAIDPYDHPITTSISVKAPEGLWNIDNIDLVMLHPYGKTDGVPKLLQHTNIMYGKPAVAGEFSYSWRSADRNESQMFRQELHLGLWRGMMSPTPILPLTWWWEFHDTQGDWHLYAPAAAFSSCMIDLNRSNWSDVRTTSDSDFIESYCIRIESKLYVWAHNNGNAIAPNSKIYLHDVPAGNYKMRLFETSTGEFREEVEIKLQESNAASSLTLPALEPTQDVALILEP